MMKTLTKDIAVTLLVKLLLLSILWFVCFKSAHKPLKTNEQWLLGEGKTTGKTS